jgi:carbon-monoxide dehydrogenase iron sulfur subunit
MKQRILLFDAVSCTGCLSCVTACSMAHTGAVSPASSRIHISFDPFENWWPAVYCRQCTAAPCAKACPVEAIRLDERQEYWYVDYERCIGCMLCIDACPLGAMFYDPHHDQVIKCDTCGGEPACVKVCATQALAWGDAADRSLYRKQKGRR